MLVRNTGYGPATRIAIAFDGAFDIDGTPVVARLLPEKSATLEIYLRPRAGNYGPKVPLGITVTFEDRSGGTYAATQRMPLRVSPKGSPLDLQTPLEIDIRGGLPHRVLRRALTSSRRVFSRLIASPWPPISSSRPS